MFHGFFAWLFRIECVEVVFSKVECVRATLFANRKRSDAVKEY